jgi:hypothetical protein
MAKQDRTERQLARLRSLRGNLRGPEAVAELKLALADGSSAVVAAAAKLAADEALVDVGPDLAAAFERLLEEGPTADKGCNAKIELVRALMRLGAPADGVFLRAVRHVQLEKGFGGPVDAAAELRAVAAVALAESLHPRALEVAAELLADPESEARIGAVRALVAISSQASALLLRYKALIGDGERSVFSECLGGMLAISGENLSFVARFLDDPREDVASLAALEIGHSRREEALAELRDAFGRRLSQEFRKSVLVAASMLRSDESFEFLRSVIAETVPEMALEALASAAAYVVDDRSRALVEEAVRDNGSRQVRDAFSALYGGRR